MLSGIGDPDQLAAAGVPVVVASPAASVTNLQDHLTAGWIVHTPTAGDDGRRREAAPGARATCSTRRGMLASNVAEAVAMIHTEPGLAGARHRADLRPGAVPRPRLHHAARATASPSASILLQPASTGHAHADQCRPDRPGRHRPELPRRPGRHAPLRRRRRPSPASCCRRRRSRRTPVSRCARTTGRPTTCEMEQLLRQYAETLYHPVGTARMGSDADSVVDEELRVRGRGRPAGGGRVGDAAHHPRPHQRTDHDDRRTGRRPDPGRRLSPSPAGGTRHIHHRPSRHPGWESTVDGGRSALPMGNQGIRSTLHSGCI